MKATINISVEVHDLGDLECVERALRFLHTNPEDGYGAEPAQKPVAKKKAAKKTAKKADPEPEPEPVAESDDVSEDDLKAAVRSTIEAVGVDAVKEIFAKHKAAKLSDLKPTQYAKVLAALKEAAELA